MKEKNILKHDKEKNWQKAVNFTPQKDEVIIYDADENNELPRIKIGDGKSNVNNLSFAGQHKFEVEDGQLTIW